MVKTQTIIKHRFLMLFILALASIIFTGCDQGSLGTKSGVIQGYVLDSETNAPISEVLVKATGTLTGAVNTDIGTSNRTVYTDGDGSFVFGSVSQGSYNISVEKYGYVLEATEGENNQVQAIVGNGETITLSPIKMTKIASGTKGILKGYPIDAITGRALTNFTLTQETPYNQRKSKTFDSAATFRDTGWTGLEGGDHTYTLTATNYEKLTLQNSTSASEGGEGANTITIGKSAVDLGTIKVTPLRIAVGGTIRNLPGYVLDDENLGGLTVWAESGGKTVATYTDFQDGAESDVAKKLGNVNYMLYVPVTSGSVTIKCKLRGYDIITISSSVSISASNPGGIISGVDVDFNSIEPIKADLRVIVISTDPGEEGDADSTFKTNERARVYIQSAGKDVVPYVDVLSVNLGGEVTVSGVITGYNIKIIVVNQNRKYCSKVTDEFKIAEGTEIYTTDPIILEKS